ncbi:MAG TPA: hypothetical protein DDW27_02825 [Bacteroidales bacterium]|nr:hypothetical protein [Bacteroidales bacterium]
MVSPRTALPPVKKSRIINQTITTMNNLFRGLISGYGAWKLGGGCFGTIVVFVVIWLVLGKCS